MKSNFLKVLIIGVTSITMTSCVKELICVNGRGPVESRTIDLPVITGVSLGESARVVIRQGNTQEIKVTAHRNILDRLQEEVFDGVWDIDLGRDCFHDLDLNIEITMQDLRKVNLAGSGDILIHDFSDQSYLDIILSGSGYIRLDSFEGATEVDAVISGSGDIYFGGPFPDLRELDITISGSGTIKAYPAVTELADVTISGSGDAYVYVTDHLKAVITGSGDVHYKGSPGVDATITGTGRVINEN